MRRLAALLFCVLPVSADTGRRPRADWYPLAEGTSWTFAYAGGEIVFTVAGSKRIGGAECTVIEAKYAGQTSWTQYVGRDSWGYKMYGMEQSGTVWTLDPAMPMLPTSASKGAKWSWKGNYYGSEYESEDEYLGEESLEVCGKKITCRKVISRAVLSGQLKMTTTHWYAPGIGPVKTEYDYDFGGGVSKQEMTLKEFKKP